MKIKDFINFLTDKRLLLAIGILFFIEILFQIGLYRSYLKKNSYAANINRVTDHVIKSRKVLEPTILIIGTSVAFEGISVRILNEELEATGEKVQSLAMRGSELIIQHYLLEKYLIQFPKVHTIIHVLEPGTPWGDRNQLEYPTLVMLSEIGNLRAISLVNEFQYLPKPSDYFLLLLKTLAYRKDLADMFINFNERIKAIARRNRNPNPNPWDYENPHPESMGPYQIDNLESCFKIADPNSKEPIPIGSNFDHRRMIFETCLSVNSLSQEPIQTERTERYFKRLNKMYSMIGERKIHVIDIFAPFSMSIRSLSTKTRMDIWDAGLAKALSPYQKMDKIDFQDSLGNSISNGDNFFDVIHLNQHGMQSFSKILAKELMKRYAK